jgi:hypothetical protein
MKQSPQEQKLLQNLKPSKFSSTGFLGTDTRPIDEIISEDRRTLEKAGIVKDKLVTRLKEIYSKAKGAFGAAVPIAPGITAKFYESMGRIPSPFSGDGVFEKGETVVTNNKTGEQAIITSLGINLIEKHDFYQGKGSRYRIEPGKVCEIIGLTE